MPPPRLGDYPDRLNPAPPPINFNDDGYRSRVRSDVIHVSKIVATFAAVARIVPGRAGKILGSLLAGVHKEPDTGKLFPTIGVAGNYLPTPLGYADANSYAMNRNWWIPDATSGYVPTIADPYLPGMADQRRIDSFISANKKAQRYQYELTAVQALSDAGISSFADSSISLAKEVVALRQNSSYNGYDLKTLASREQDVRTLPNRPPPLVPVIVEVGDGTFRAALIQLPDAASLPPLRPPGNGDEQDITIQEFVLGKDGANGSFFPIKVKPNTLLAIATFERMEFARQDYVTERADP